MSAVNITFAETVATAVFSSGVGWGVLQWFLTRKQRRDEHLRKIRDDEKQSERDRTDRERADGERRELLAEAQATAQRTALDSAASRYRSLEQDYVSCREGLRDVRDASALLIDVFESLLMKLQPFNNGESYTVTLQASEVIGVRHSITEARRHLLYFTDWRVPLRDEPPLRADRPEPQDDHP